MVKAKRLPHGAATAVKALELAVAAPQVIAHRVSRMALAGPVPSARDRQEFTRMVVEKQLAFGQAWMAWSMEALGLQQRLLFAWFAGAAPHQHASRLRSGVARLSHSGLAPIHRKAVANARRLARPKLR